MDYELISFDDPSSFTITLEDELSGGWKDFEAGIRKEVFGQERAIQKVIRSIMYIDSGLHNIDNGPPPPLFFAGPSGVGKTLLAKVVARMWLGIPSTGENEPLIHIAGENYNKSHSGASLIGAPPGYVGHGATESPLKDIGKFDERATRKNIWYIAKRWMREKISAKDQKSVIGKVLKDRIKIIAEKKLEDMRPFRSALLIDEMEKMHPEVQRQLLGILNDGFLRLNTGEEIDFRRTLIMFTSNIGTDKVARILDGNQVGFQPVRIEKHSDTDQEIYEIIRDEVKNYLDPALYSRIGHEGVVVFHALSSENYHNIIDKELLDLHNTIIGNSSIGGVFQLTTTPEFYDFILGKADAASEGARQITRLIDKYVRQSLAKYIASGEVYNGDIIKLIVEENPTGKSSIVFKRASRPSDLDSYPLGGSSKDILEEDIVSQLDRILPNIDRYVEEEIIKSEEEE
ncbi:MAG: AAA family ATPase [Candidatus Spechtbacterales bacterium]|nr:AAA family ATPase [Candidatus Spechtbacterales bacterium]